MSEQQIRDENKKEDIILSIKDLSISFKTTAGIVNAIRGFNLDVKRGDRKSVV